MERWKEPREGSEIDPEIVCLQGVGADLFCDGVLFVERSSELIISASLSHLAEAQWKRAWIGRNKYIGLDPKPGDLSMGRLKLL